MPNFDLKSITIDMIFYKVKIKKVTGNVYSQLIGNEIMNSDP